MRYHNETDYEYIERLERELADYRLLPEDYPTGRKNYDMDKDLEDIAFRRARSWASMWARTHAGLDQQVRVCVSMVCKELEELRAEVAELRKQLSDASWREYPEAMGR